MKLRSTLAVGGLLLSLATLAALAAPAHATTNACVDQTTLAVSACATAGPVSHGDGSCVTPNSGSGGHVAVGVRAAGATRGVGANNVCYAYHPEGYHPYAGSQVAFHVYSAEDGEPPAWRGAYLNAGTVHAPGGDHPYCYVTTYTQNGEDGGPRVACPAHVQPPVLLDLLP